MRESLRLEICSREFAPDVRRNCATASFVPLSVPTPGYCFAMELALAIDIGATKLAVGVVDEQGRLFERVSAPTPPEASGDDVFDHLAELVSGLHPSIGSPAAALAARDR